MHPAILITLLFTVSDASEEGNVADYVSASGCSTVSGTISRVTTGWPFLVDCQEIILASSSFSYYESNQEEKVYDCVVSSGGRVLHTANVTLPGNDVLYLYDAYSDRYTISAVSEDQNGTVFTATLVGAENCSASYTLVVEEPGTELSCGETSFQNEQTRELVQGDHYPLKCLADKNTLFLDAENYEVTWYKNCQQVKRVTKSGREVSGEFVDVDQLLVTGTNFNTTPGEYTCSVTYNGYERFLSRTNVCVKYNTPNGPPAIRQITPTEVQKSAGQDVTLTCGGFTNSVAQISFAVIWLKNLTNGTEQILCTEYLFPTSGEQNLDEKYNCNLLTNANEVSTCYYNYEEAMMDQHRGIIRMNSSLTIRDFQKRDAGEYICRVISTRPVENVAFRVEFKAPNRLIVILSSVIGALLLLFVCLILAVCIRRRNLEKKWLKELGNSSSESHCVRQGTLPKCTA